MLISAVFSLSGCASHFEQIVDAREQNFHVQCDNSETLFGSSLEECKVAACDYNSLVFQYLDDVCEVLLCGVSRPEDLKLIPVPTAGWNIYFWTEVTPRPERTSTVSLLASDTDSNSQELTFIPTEPSNTTHSISASNEEPGRLLPVWATAVIVSGATLCIVAILVIGILCKRRHQKRSLNQSSPIELRERSEREEGRGEREESTQDTPYEEITNSNQAVRNINENGSIVQNTDEDPDGYLRLVPDN